MLGLDERGQISVVVVAVYVIIFGLALVLTFRHGYSRQSGWLELLIFCIFRVAGGVIHIVAEKVDPPVKGLFIAAYVLEGVGLGPLLLCTASFLEVAGSPILGKHPFLNQRKFSLVRIAIIAGLVAQTIGSSIASSSDSDAPSILRYIGAIILVICYVLLALYDLLIWKVQDRLTEHNITLLKCISGSLAFLAVRVLYSTLSSFSSSSVTTEGDSSSSSKSVLAEFNSSRGSWELFLLMSVLMEFAVVALYVTFGLSLPISKGMGYHAVYADETSRTQLDLISSTRGPASNV
ncbi:hypothetical protein DFH11DRAFT_1542372 [Phellopilus nigrolimitatus]|nr:hypothetical protein DFH11DRAFT_1542372 [Phellopilus nigrolimitatus]